MLTVAMLLGVMPADLLGGIASVKAAETVHEVNFVGIDSSVTSDKANIPEGSTYGDGYFKVIGSKATFRYSEKRDNIVLNCLRIINQEYNLRYLESHQFQFLQAVQEVVKIPI